tara:strand:- start:356 stop:514 length:159 start_codon:yes stop_codon:yes gene_type:complete
MTSNQRAFLAKLSSLLLLQLLDPSFENSFFSFFQASAVKHPSKQKLLIENSA